MTDRKTPGMAFWVTVVLVVAPLALLVFVPSVVIAEEGKGPGLPLRMAGLL